MADQPEAQKPVTADTTAADTLSQESLQLQQMSPEPILTPEEAAGSARIIGQIAKGAAKQIVEHPLKTAGEVAAGAGAVAAGAYFGVTAAGAAAIAAVPAAGYGIYKGIDIARTEGVGAIPDHLKRFYDETVQTIDSKVSAMQMVFTGSNEKDPKLQAAKEEVQGIGAAIIPLAAGLIGGNPANGELGAQGIRMATGMAEKAATEIARATLPLEPVPALVTGTMQTAKEVSAIAKGSPTIPSVAAAQETAVFSQNTGGEGGNNPTDANSTTGIRRHVSGNQTIEEFNPPKSVSTLTGREENPLFGGFSYREADQNRLIAKTTATEGRVDSYRTDFADGGYDISYGSGRYVEDGPFKGFYVDRMGKDADGTLWAHPNDPQKAGGRELRIKPDGTREPEFTNPKSREEIAAEQQAQRVIDAKERLEQIQVRIREAEVRRDEVAARRGKGRSQETLDDGGTVSINSKGETFTEKPDGTHISVYEDGKRTTWRGPVQRPSYSMTEYPDGSVSVYDFSTPRYQILPDGTLLLYDTSGRLSETSGGSLMETEISPQGRIVRIRNLDHDE